MSQEFHITIPYPTTFAGLQNARLYACQTEFAPTRNERDWRHHHFTKSGKSKHYKAFSTRIAEAFVRSGPSNTLLPASGTSATELEQLSIGGPVITQLASVMNTQLEKADAACRLESSPCTVNCPFELLVHSSLSVYDENYLSETCDWETEQMRVRGKVLITDHQHEVPHQSESIIDPELDAKLVACVVPGRWPRSGEADDASADRSIGGER